ncbi:glycosyltransferase family 2 protein [Aurantiacibacter poecillastricola]|uniref:glycosyltransferase family 2 protein n=1 Tax=Aurantiacibacter poecillastricola TaxID=3064385 RepID=UPI00273E99C8|nr:galactosyltransferase-related protein [Aurantiacibacter sp. 219JJ12-13]MDP5261145.1 galactosyltransferase-related protein [Aurantiacibacter sp. 219JJ12-13]
MKVSVCTLAHGRETHLATLVRGLSHSRRPPCELVIAVMQGESYRLPETSFPIRQIVLGSNGIPLAKGRNTAARAARSDLLVFLDVDCIAHPDLIADYARAAETHEGVLMGEVGYLPAGATRAGIDFDHFESLAVKHSERPGPPASGLSACRDYRCFWSLNFAIAKRDFDRTSGFDESFVGYGGEDTDFGRTVAETGLPLWWLKGAKAYHQYHPHFMPPVHHLESVLDNAERFRRKWGQPTMQHWLRAFRLMGLIERDGDRWRILREPGPADFELTRQQEDQPYASSAVVLEQLEAEAEREASKVAAIAAA